jgi:hypothetical protein
MLRRPPRGAWAAEKRVSVDASFPRGSLDRGTCTGARPVLDSSGRAEIPGLHRHPQTVDNASQFALDRAGTQFDEERAQGA